MSKLHPMHKVIFSFSELWRAPSIPYLNVDSDFIKARNLEVNSCFGEIELRIQKIDVSCETAEYDLRKALHVVSELRRYSRVLNKDSVKKTGVAFVPYTASNKGRIGGNT